MGINGRRDAGRHFKHSHCGSGSSLRNGARDGHSDSTCNACGIGRTSNRHDARNRTTCARDDRLVSGNDCDHGRHCTQD